MSTDVDVDAIRALKHRYCWCFDDGDLEGLLALFTGNAVCELGPFGSWHGIAEIRAGYARQMVDSGVPGGRLHSVTNELIDVEGDSATGRWYIVDYDIMPGAAAPVRIIGSYTDDYSRVDDRWLIARTAVQIRWRAPS
jgi:hypothetical protein